MGSINQFLEQMDWISLLAFVVSALVSLLCLTVHELAHGLAADRLGDPTAKLNGRLTLNPFSHVDWIGLFLLLMVGVGWAKPVPVDLRNFKRPKRDMALTALAGPLSNFLLAFVVLFVGHLLIDYTPHGGILPYVLLFVCRMAVLSVGLGLFNLIPIPPLDGSRIVNACLPDRLYGLLLRYERYLIVAVVLLAWSGWMGGPLSRAIHGVMEGLCVLSGFPMELVEYYFF